MALRYNETSKYGHYNFAAVEQLFHVIVKIKDNSIFIILLIYLIIIDLLCFFLFLFQDYF